MMAAGHTMPDGAFSKARQFAGQHRTAVRAGAIAIVIAALIGYAMLHTAGQAPVHQAPVITMVVIQPPKPPPPPPPLPQPKMITQPKMVIPTTKPLVQAPVPKSAPPKPAAPAAIPMGTSIHNNGPADAFNLSGTPGGNGFLGGGGGGGGDLFSYYDAIWSAQIRNALQKNAVTRNAAAGLQVRLWVDAGGIVTRVVLDKSSGNAAVDAAVQNQVLQDMRLSQPPPAGMPMPIIIALTGEGQLQ